MECSMKKFVLLLFFVVPHLMYASFETHACNKALERIDAEWATRTTLVVQFEAVPKEDKMPGVPFLQKAIESCQRAIGNCDYILGKIEHKSKREREQHYWTHVKGECKQYKTVIFQEIDRLNGMIFAVHLEDAGKKAEMVWKKGFDRAEYANRMRQEHPRRLDNIEEVKGMLNDAAKLYAEANSIIKEVFPILTQYSNIETVNDYLLKVQKAMEACQNEVLHCHKESMEWAETIVYKVMEVQNKLAPLVAGRDVLIDQGNTQELKALEEKMIPLIKELIGYGDTVPAELNELIDKYAKAGK